MFNWHRQHVPTLVRWERAQIRPDKPPGGFVDSSDRGAGLRGEALWASQGPLYVLIWQVLMEGEWAQKPQVLPGWLCWWPATMFGVNPLINSNRLGTAW